MGLKSRIARRLGRRGQPPPDNPPPDLEAEFLRLYRHCKPFTMTSIERMYAVYQAVRHLDRSHLEGDIVECGVWRGGSSMMAAMSLAEPRRLWLYDTFEGMTTPTDLDVSHKGDDAAALEGQLAVDPEHVRRNLLSVGVADNHLRLVKGKVEDTIPAEAPGTIALLRLDTDWYESTRHELEHLYPRLVSGGVLLIDDYGHWAGARAAVDEYFADEPLLLHRIDYTGRIAVKP